MTRACLFDSSLLPAWEAHHLSELFICLFLCVLVGATRQTHTHTYTHKSTWTSALFVPGKPDGKSFAVQKHTRCRQVIDGYQLKRMEEQFCNLRLEVQSSFFPDRCCCCCCHYCCSLATWTRTRASPIVFVGFSSSAGNCSKIARADGDCDRLCVCDGVGAELNPVANEFSSHVTASWRCYFSNRFSSSSFSFSSPSLSSGISGAEKKQKMSTTSSLLVGALSSFFLVCQRVWYNCATITTTTTTTTTNTIRVGPVSSFH